MRVDLTSNPRGARDRERLQGRLGALLVAQFLGAFNANALRFAIALLGVASVTTGLPPEDRVAAAQTGMTIAFAVFTLPMVLVSIPAGILADRLNKRSVIIATKVLELVLMLIAIPVLHSDPSGGFFSLCLLASMGAQSALFSPAKYGILPEILSERELSAGNGLLEMWTFLAIIAGTYAGGAIVWVVGENTALIGVTFALLSVAGVAAAVRVPRVVSSTARGGIGATWGIAWSTVRSDRLLRFAVLGTVGFWALASLVSQDILVYSRFVLGLSEGAATVPLAVLGIGIGAGSFVAGRLAGDASLDPVEYGLIPAGAVGIAVTCSLLGFVGPGFVGTLALMIPLGVASGMLAIPLNVIVQWRSPSARRGAVIALSNTFVFAGVLGGSFAADALSRMGLSPTQILVSAAAMALVGAAAASTQIPGALRALVRRCARRLSGEEP
ncbi:MAG: MFS transporter [Myxococcota bacterium]